MEYAEVYSFQQKCIEEISRGGRESLLVCEHPSVLTLGPLARQENILFPRDEITKKGIKIHSVDRGGDVTLHSPGQLILYPILNLKNYGKDLRCYLYRLEQVVIDFLRGFDILALRIPGKTGIWVEGEKIASIGIGVKKWISFHGVAVNINTDLSLFSLIKPCGLDVRMTSVREIKGKEIDGDAAKTRLIKMFCRNFKIVVGAPQRGAQ